MRISWFNGNQIIPEPASSRYTEVRLSKVGLEFFEGIKKKNVPFISNFDETNEWPEVLPTPFPSLLINGSEGIGTTIAQTWLPYDFTEASNAYKHYLETGEMDWTLSPSFPSGGIIVNKNELSTILKTGKGKVVLRAKAEFEKNNIYITEICYQTCVRDLMEDFKKLYQADELKGVEDIQNMSGKNGIKIKIVCEKDASPKAVLEMLYKKTRLQENYNANQNLLINKIPKLVTTQEYFDLLYKHNDECLCRELNYDRQAAEDRIHILEGLLKALEDIDNIIKLIKSSSSSMVAKEKLITTYNFSEVQAKAILDMKLSKLANLEKIELQNEYNKLKEELKEILKLLNDISLRKEKIIINLSNLLNKYHSNRKTELTQIDPPKKEDKEIAHVEPEKCVVIMTEDGNIKRIPATSFKTQRRNGKGVKTLGEITTATIRTNTIDSLMVFTDRGKMYRILVDNIPVGTNTSKGQPINSLIEMEYGEKATLIYSIYRDTDAKYVLFATKNGLIKKTSLDEYIGTKKRTGMNAITLKEGDSLVSVNLVKDEELIILTKNGMGIRFNSLEVGATGRATSGVKGIALGEDDAVIAVLPIRDKNDDLAIFSKDGHGKRIKLNEMILQKRAGKGLIVHKDSIAAGALICDDDNILVIGTNNSICFSAKDMPTYGRGANGIIIIKGNITSISKV